MDWHWNEPTLEWINSAGVKPYESWLYDEDTQQWIPPVDYPENYNRIEWAWNEETLTWEEI
jgi:hypothetical protein